MLRKTIFLLIAICSTLMSSLSFAHYPILTCSVQQTNEKKVVICEASFSNRAKAPNVIMEIFSDEDEVLASGTTDDQAMYQFPLPDSDYFILMDAGPGHVLEISNDEVSNTL